MLGSVGALEGLPVSYQDSSGMPVEPHPAWVWGLVSRRGCWCEEGECGSGACWALHTGEEGPGLGGRDFSAL